MIYKKLKKPLLIEVEGCFLAGGAILSHVTNTEVADYDLYPKKKEDIASIINFLIQELGCQVVSETERSITFKTSQVKTDDGNRLIIQLIVFDEFATPEKIFETFDFTVCMAAYDYDTKEFHYHPQFFEDVASRNLNFNTATNFPYASLIRTKKYAHRGYHLSKGEMLKIGVTIANAGLPKSWEDLEMQIGGFYGRTISINSEGIDFNFDNIIKVLSETDFSAANYEEDSKVHKYFKEMVDYEHWLIHRKSFRNEEIHYAQMGSDTKIYIKDGKLTKYYLSGSIHPSVEITKKGVDAHNYNKLEQAYSFIDKTNLKAKTVDIDGYIVTDNFYIKAEDVKVLYRNRENYYDSDKNDMVPYQGRATVYVRLTDAIQQTRELIASKPEYTNVEFKYLKVSVNSNDVIQNVFSHEIFNAKNITVKGI